MWWRWPLTTYMNSNQTIANFRRTQSSRMLVSDMWTILGRWSHRTTSFSLGSCVRTGHGVVAGRLFLLLHHLDFIRVKLWTIVSSILYTSKTILSPTQLGRSFKFPNCRPESITSQSDPSSFDYNAWQCQLSPSATAHTSTHSSWRATSSIHIGRSTRSTGSIWRRVLCGARFQWCRSERTLHLCYVSAGTETTIAGKVW